MTEISFTCHEYLGTEVYKSGALDIPLLVRSDVKAGDTLMIPGLMGDWWEMIVKEDAGKFYGEAGRMRALLEYDMDDRHCWTCGGLINTRCLEKLTLSSV